MDLLKLNEIPDYEIGAPYYIPDVKWTTMFNFSLEDKNKRKNDVTIYDVTLRDGDQTPGVVFLEDERVRIADCLAEMKVPRIEAGLPVVSKAVENAMRRMVAKNYPHSKIYGFSRALASDVLLCKDIGCDGITIEYTVNPYIIKHAYQDTPAELLDKLVNAINLAKENHMDTAFMGWDWFRAPMEFTQWIVDNLYDKTQMDGLVMVDTYGNATPDAVEEMFRIFKERYSRLRLEFHGHNDIGCGNANCLAAIRGGADVIHTAFNGLGERCGNVATEEMAVLLEMHKGINTGIDLSKISSTSKIIEAISKVPVHNNKPVLGTQPYKIETGIGMDIQYKLAHVGKGFSLTNYAITVNPAVIGRAEGVEMVLGKCNGKNSIRLILDKYGFAYTDEQVEELLNMVVDEAFVTKSLVSEQQFFGMVNKVCGKEYIL